MPKPGPKPLQDGRDTKNIAARMHPAAREMLFTLAKAEGLSVAKYVGRALEAHVTSVTDIEYR